MRILRSMALLLGLGTTMCGSKEHPKPATKPASSQAAKPASAEAAAKTVQEEKKMAQERWLEVSAASRKFLITKVADDKHRPTGDFEGLAALGKPGMVLFYILVPNDAASAEIKHVSGGKTAALAKPMMINRMPGSALYTSFLADPAQPGSLAFKVAGKQESVSLDAKALQALPWFWSGEPPSIALEEVPGWMERSGP